MNHITHTVSINRYTGTHVEIGRQLGKRVREWFGSQYINNALNSLKDNFLYKALGMNFALTQSYIDKVFPVVEEALLKVHAPLLEEMQGFAESLGEDYKKFLVFLNNFGDEHGCSQFFLNGFHARNYDDAPNAVENEFQLVYPQGSFASFGASTSFVERLDGMNEKGLVISLTFGAGYPPKQYGISSALFQRIVLDKAATVEEALNIFTQIPYVTPNNVLISDAKSNAVVIEVSAGKYRIRKIEENILVCANSYLHEEMKDQQRYKNPTTKWREQKMQEFKDSLENEQAIMDLLTTDFPIGLFEPYFTEGLGTLWSVIYHPKSKRIYLAVGEKDHGRQEVTFDLNNPSFQGLPMTLTTQLINIELDDRISQY